MQKSPLRLLLVDDDEDERLIVGDLLEAASTEKFDLTWAPSYDEGLCEILSGRYEVCLVDYRLGEYSGLDLLAAVTGKETHPQVILLTNVNDRGIDILANRAGAADYLVKGELTAALLERSIRYAVERGRRLKALREAAEVDSMSVVKSTFLAAMSHETRTPMNIIMGMGDMLWDSSLNQEQMGYVESLRRASANLLLVINDILELSSIHSARLELERVEFDLEQLLDQIVEANAGKARAKGLALMFRLGTDVATALIGDASKVRQVITSLLANAIKFTASGEVLITIQNATADSTGEIEFSISDTGIGIPAEKLQAIFGDFIQADTSATRRYSGAGLGLGISRRLVEAMGGVLIASSHEGMGSDFRFTLKFNLPASVRGDKNTTAENLCGKRVLLIDDNAASSSIFQAAIRAAAGECHAFTLKAEALARLMDPGEAPYAIAILSTDCAPQFDCFETGMEIRRICPGLPVLLLTSNSRARTQARHVARGSFGYAVKPIGRAHLFRLINDVMQAIEHPIAEPKVNSGDIPRSARILVVDDSPDNRELVQVYLMSSPYQLTFEEDGRAAVNRFASADFDLVLMDVQMPIMDGLTATRAIRLLEQEQGKTAVPIIVISANSSLQDMEASSQAGCNVHLAKPLSKIDLIKVIEEYERPFREQASKSEIRLEPIHIHIPRGLEDIVPSYLVRRRKEVFEMRDLAASSNFSHLATLAHNLKGTGAGYGFPDLTRLGARLNLSATQGDREAVETQITELSNYLDRVHVES